MVIDQQKLEWSATALIVGLAAKEGFVTWERAANSLGIEAIKLEAFLDVSSALGFRAIVEMEQAKKASEAA